MVLSPVTRRSQDGSLEPSNPDMSPSKSPETDEVAAVLSFFQLHKAGQLPRQQWQKFSLSQAGYRKLQESIQKHDNSLHRHIKDKIRYSYFPRFQQLVIRMPTGVHEVFIENVSDEIKAQLVSIGAGQSSSASFARDVIAWRSTDVHPLDPDYGMHSPDASFGHGASALPGVVLEVSYAQKRGDLPHLANEYLLGSNANIQMVIGLDLEYRGSRATFSIWKLTTKVEPKDRSLFWEVKQIVVDEIFCGPGVNHSTGLRIPLADFANPAVRAQYLQPITGEIYISTLKLCGFFIAAQAKHLIIKKGSNNMPLPDGMKKKKWEVTPPKELLKIHEDRFEDDERRAFEIMDADSSFDSSTLSPGSGSASSRVLRPRPASTGDDISLTGDDISLTGDDISLTGDDISLAGDDISLADDDIPLASKDE